MALSDEANSGAERRTAVPGAVWVVVRMAVVFAATLSIYAGGIQPPGWSGRVAVWLLGSGIALAAVIRWGWVQYFPIYAANVLIDVLTRHAVGPALVAEVGLPAGVFLTVRLLRHYDFHCAFDRGRDMPVFLGAALVGMFIPAAVGVATFATWRPIDPMDHTPWTIIDLFRWWLNDFMGVLILGPLLVAVRWRSFRPLIDRPASSVLFLILLAGIMAIMVFAPSLWPAYQLVRSPILLASTVLVAAVCLRFGLVPAAAAGLALTAAAVSCISFDTGILRGLGQIPGLVTLWTYMCAMSLPVLLLTWLLAERRRLEQRYEQLFDACPQPLWVHDRSTGRFLVVNTATERQYGYSREELVKSSVEMLSPAGEVQTLATLLGSEAIQPIELRHRTRDGTIIFVEAWAQLVDYDDRAAWLIFAFDVSERKSLEGALVTAISGEQRRLGQDLHDGLAQDLTVASILISELVAQFNEHKLPMFPEVGRLSDRISSALANARNVAHGLSPLANTNGDLAAALTLLASASTVSETRVQVSADIEDNLRMPLESRTHLYRIAQEAIQNALKHADARRIDVRLTVLPTKVILEIEDDGHGMRSDGPRSTGFGTNTMRYRSSAIDGVLAFRSAPEGGTVIRCVAPQPPEEKHRALLIG